MAQRLDVAQISTDELMQSAVDGTRRQRYGLRSDHEIIERYQASGDAKELNELVNRHLTRVRRLVFEMVLDDGVADDLTQEVFLRAVRGLKRFRGRARFSTWLYRITMNTVYTHLQRSRPSRTLEDSSELLATDTTPDEASMYAELVTDIESAIRALSPKLRAAIVLTTIHHKSPQESAEIEGCTTTTMYWRIHEARKQLRNSLKRHLK